MKKRVWDLLMYLSAIIMMLFAVASVYIIPVNASTSATHYYSTTVMVTRQYYDSHNNYLYDLEEVDGDFFIGVWNPEEQLWDCVPMTFSGNGDYWTEEYTISDDATCGDLYKAIIYTRGTVDKSDDYIVLSDYIGCVLPSNKG